MSRQRVFFNQPAPTTSTKTTPSGNLVRVSDIFVTTDDERYEFLGSDGSDNAIWRNEQDYLDGKADKPATNQTAPVSETRATATYTGASNAGFILYSKLLGTAGNAITYTITTAADDNLAITVTGNAITIALANTTSSKNTAILVKAAIEAKAEANALVAIVLTGTGAGVVATQAVASLTGGLNGTAGYQGQVIFDTNGNRWELEYISGGSYYWVSRNTIRTITELSAVSVSDNIIMLDSASYFSQPLPIQPIYAGKKILVKNKGTMTVNVDTVPMLPGDIVEFLSDGANWMVSYRYVAPYSCKAYADPAINPIPAVGSYVKYQNKLSLGISYSSGTGLFTLLPGAIYKATWKMDVNNTNNSVVSYAVRNNTTSTDMYTATGMPVTATSNYSLNAINMEVIDLSAINILNEIGLVVKVLTSTATNIVGNYLMVERIA
jgi:hypothetical protein